MHGLSATLLNLRPAALALYVSRRLHSLTSQGPKRLYAREGCHVAGLVEKITVEAGVRRKETGIQPLTAAGVTAIAPLEQISSDDFDAIVGTNLTGAFLLIRTLLPAMKAHGRGWLIPILSVAARRGFPGWSAYCASDSLFNLYHLGGDELAATVALQPRRARSSEVSHDDMRAVGCKRSLGCRSPQG
jgi:short subunit dehydrogenase